MPFRSYCRLPPKTTKKHVDGSCRDLFQDLLSELKGARTVNAALYLFNNPNLYSFLRKMADNGTKVNVVSLPLTAYNEKKVKVEGLGETSKRDQANKIYSKILSENVINLSIFPHMYVWSGARYAGGGPSYSFHIKAFLADFGRGKQKCVVSSGNFATGDPPHSENMIVIENNQTYIQAFKRFFKDLLNSAIPYEDYQGKEQKDDFLFIPGKTDVSRGLFSKAFFTSPFYTIGNIGSNHYASQKIIGLLKKAEERILICSQHFHDISPYDPEASSIISALNEIKQSNRRIKIYALKQVSSKGWLADKRRAAMAEFFFQRELKAQQRRSRLVHDKFIIVDADKINVCTSNYTPSQFAWDEGRIMKFKDEDGVHKKTDTFSEVNAFVILENAPKIAKQYEDHFWRLWKTATEIRIEL